MPYKPLPKPCSEKALQKKYAALAELTHGRVDVATDAGRQLSELMHRYLAAFANLYGLITVVDAWDILCETEPQLIGKKKFLKKDFLYFNDVLRAENLPYYVLNVEEVFSDEKNDEPQDRLIVHKKLVSRGYGKFFDLFTLMDSQANKPLAVLEKDEYMEWASPEKFRTTRQAQEFLRFLESLQVSNKSKKCDENGNLIRGKRLDQFVYWSKSQKSLYSISTRKWEKEDIENENNLPVSEKIMRAFERFIQLGDARIRTSDFLELRFEELKEMDVSLSEKQVNQFMQLYQNLNNYSRLWCNCGWAPEELFQESHASGRAPQSDAMPDFAEEIQKALQNGEITPEQIKQLFGPQKILFS